MHIRHKHTSTTCIQGVLYHAGRQASPSYGMLRRREGEHEEGEEEEGTNGRLVVSGGGGGGGGGGSWRKAKGITKLRCIAQTRGGAGVGGRGGGRRNDVFGERAGG
jgi:hypothetical protein